MAGYTGGRVYWSLFFSLSWPLISTTKGHTSLIRRLSPMDPTPRRKGVAESQDRGVEGVESASRGPSRRLGPPRETIRTPATSSVVAFKATSFPSWSLVLKGSQVDKDFLKEVFDHECLPRVLKNGAKHRKLYTVLAALT